MQPTSYERPAANFGQRLGAALLDGLIVGVPITILFFVLGATLPRGEPEFCTDLDGNPAICEPLTGASVAILILFGLLSVAFGLWYFAIRVGQTGKTIGRGVVGIEVVDDQSGEYIGAGRGVGRYFADDPVRASPATSATCGCSGTIAARPGTTRSSAAESSVRRGIGPGAAIPGRRAGAPPQGRHTPPVAFAS